MYRGRPKESRVNTLVVGMSGEVVLNDRHREAAYLVHIHVDCTTVSLFFVGLTLQDVRRNTRKPWMHWSVCTPPVSRFDMTWHDLTWLDMTWHDLTWLDTTSTTWHDLTWPHTTWRGLTQIPMLPFGRCLRTSYTWWFWGEFVHNLTQQIHMLLFGRRVRTAARIGWRHAAPVLPGPHSGAFWLLAFAKSGLNKEHKMKSLITGWRHAAPVLPGPHSGAFWLLGSVKVHRWLHVRLSAESGTGNLAMHKVTCLNYPVNVLIARVLKVHKWPHVRLSAESGTDNLPWALCVLHCAFTNQESLIRPVRNLHA
jgi:hypothetical protein